MVNTSARSTMMAAALQYMTSQAIYVAARLGLADLLADGPAQTDRLATECSADPRTMGKLLRALVAGGVLVQEGPDRFALTEIGHALRDGVDNSVRNFVLLYCSPAVWNSWANLADTVATGRTAFRTTHDMSAFEYCGAHPDVAALFHRAMAEDASQVAEGLAVGYDFSGLGTVADVGGGNGTLLAGVLAGNPALRGILFDTEGGVATAPTVLGRAGVADRCSIVAGDFFVSVPAADAHVLKSTVHDWSDEDATRILATCRRAMDSGGRVLLVERVLPTVLPARVDHHAVRHQLAGPVIMGGQERTAEEFQKLLEAAGFELAAISEPLGDTGYHVIDGRPV